MLIRRAADENWEHFGRVQGLRWVFFFTRCKIENPSVGFAIVRLDKFFTIDEVVFAEKGDLLLL